MADGSLLFDTKIDTKGFEKGTSALGSLGKGVGSVVATGLKATVAGVTAAATGIGALATLSIKAFSDYEQLVGGVDTLFKDSSQKLQAYANDAYKTAGLSANDYMQTATSFSASLLQSLGGDTEKAAEYANSAIIDMSDNANKMGTSIGSIQDAYQGFAKQNYTMLDNLKLGYGGTKEEMQRLLDDASKISGIKYDISSYADVTQAIHVMQESMGIAGTTAEEASKTIQGSVGAMMASWSNLLVGLSDDNANFNVLIDNFVSSVASVAENILPRVGIALKGIGMLVEELLPIIVSRIPEIINDILPGLFKSGMNLITTLLDGITSNQEALSNGLTEILVSAINGISLLLPNILEAALQIVESLANGLLENQEQLNASLSSMIVSALQGLGELLPNILEAAIQLVTSFVEGLYQNKDQIATAIGQMIYDLVTVIITNAPAMLDAAGYLIEMILQGILNGIYLLFDAGYQLVLKLWEGIKANAQLVLDAFGQLVYDSAQWIIGKASSLWNSAGELVRNIWQGIKDNARIVLDAFGDLVYDSAQWVIGKASDMAGAGKDLVKGIWNGISDGYKWITEKISGWVENVVDFIKDKFGIASPSKVMRDEVGKYLGQGIYVGFEKEDPMKQIQNNLKAGVNSIQAKAFFNGSNRGMAQTTTQQVINFNRPVQSPVEIARTLRMQQTYGLAGAY